MVQKTLTDRMCRRNNLRVPATHLQDANIIPNTEMLSHHQLNEWIISYTDWAQPLTTGTQQALARLEENGRTGKNSLPSDICLFS